MYWSCGNSNTPWLYNLYHNLSCSHVPDRLSHWNSRKLTKKMMISAVVITQVWRWVVQSPVVVMESQRRVLPLEVMMNISVGVTLTSWPTDGEPQSNLTKSSTNINMSYVRVEYCDIGTLRSEESCLTLLLLLQCYYICYLERNTPDLLVSLTDSDFTLLSLLISLSLFLTALLASPAVVVYKYQCEDVLFQISSHPSRQNGKRWRTIVKVPWRPKWRII